jgi:hypothetical protein
MIHANLVEGGVFFGVAALTLLLMMFLYAVNTADPGEAARTEAPLMQSAVLPPPALPVRRAQALTPPVFAAETGQPGGTGYAAMPSAAASVTSAPEVSGGSRRGPAAVLVFLIAGLALTVIGGGMFFGAGQDVTVCSNQVLAVCSDGFVVLHTAQLPGGALAVGGIGLVATAIVLALR